MSAGGESSVDLYTRFRAGDARAEFELFARYTERLVALARSRLSKKLSARVDPEDIVQSAYRSFVGAVRDNRFSVERSGDLWRLLAAVTIHKTLHQARRHTTGKRDVHREEVAASDTEESRFDPTPAIARGPSPSEALIAVEEVERALLRLSPAHRPILELRLQGHLVREIAEKVDRSERLVRKVLEQVRTALEAEFPQPAAG